MTATSFCHILIIWMVFSRVLSEDCNPNICSMTKIKKMRAADCYAKDLRNVPTCFSANIEILDLSYNRIRKLRRDDLSNYSSLKVLYLSDNMISVIEPGAFDNANSLIALDLSINGITDLSPKIFNLPSLSKLYLSQNANMNIIDVIEQVKPINSPLSRLDISFNELESLPDLGEMVHLIEYNISGNFLMNLAPRMFAGLCNLKYLHSSNMTVDFVSSCDCWAVNSWLMERQVKFEQFKCDTPYSTECLQNIDQDSLKIYEKCKESHQKMVTQAKLMKIVLPCVVVSIVIVIGIMYYVYRKKQQKKRISKTANNSEALNPLNRPHTLLMCELKNNLNKS